MPSPCRACGGGVPCSWRRLGRRLEGGPNNALASVTADCLLTGPRRACRLARSAAADYIVTDLGTLGGRTSQAIGISENGLIVGDAETAAGQTHAFLYENGVMQDLGTLGGTGSVAHTRSMTPVTGSRLFPDGNRCDPRLPLQRRNHAGPRGRLEAAPVTPLGSASSARCGRRYRSLPGNTGAVNAFPTRLVAPCRISARWAVITARAAQLTIWAKWPAHLAWGVSQGDAGAFCSPVG